MSQSPLDLVWGPTEMCLILSYRKGERRRPRSAQATLLERLSLPVLAVNTGPSV